MTTAAFEPKEHLALRSFRTLAVLVGGTAALTTLGIAAGTVVGSPMDAGPATLMAAVSVLHLGKDLLLGLMAGRERFGVSDGLAMRLAKDAYAVARREDSGAWVVLTDKGGTVSVMDRAAFETFANERAAAGEVMKVVRFEGETLRVERFEGGVLTSGAEPGDHGIVVMDRKGEWLDYEVVEEDVPAPADRLRIRVLEDGSFKDVPKWVTQAADRAAARGR